MKKFKFKKSLIAVLLTTVMICQTIMPLGFFSSALSITSYEGGAGTTVVDFDTSTKYSESLGDNASTEYAGRVWTDKSVYNNNVTFTTFGGGEETITLNEAQNGEDFLVAYSALATAKSISGQAHAPVDVVFIIDTSGSMSNSSSRMDNNKTRIANTVDAVNDAIEELMEMHEDSRVAVVAFSQDASTLLPLDHYTKRTVNGSQRNFLSLNTTSAGQSATITVNAVNSKGDNVNTTRNVTGGTNIQRGIYQGMNILATEESTTVNADGSVIQRIPSVVLLSDGAPTYSVNSDNWWAPSGNSTNGDGNSSYYGNSFKALMTGAYMKKLIDSNYNVAGTSYATNFYTIGMGIEDLSNYESSFFYNYYTGEKDLAYLTLNPRDYWNADNDMAESIRNAWDSYTQGRDVNVQVNSSSTYEIEHPSVNEIYTSTDKTALQNLVKSYYDANNASAVASVFNQIVSNITISAPTVPTEISSGNPTNDGYITYTDPIGEYMEVKDVKAIIYAGNKFETKSITTENGETTYTFAGAVHSAVYGDQNIDDIIITVNTDANNRQTLTVKIPASVIPLRVNTVTLNEDGSVKTHTNNGAYPARVIYSVGLQDGIVKKCAHGDFYIDTSRISSDYLAKNTNRDGTINFYANIYSGNYTVNGSTAGDATVTFEPSNSNAFYYVLEDMPIYSDPEFKNQVSAAEGIDDNKTYYYNDVYYHGISVESDAIERTGAQLKQTAIITGQDGNLYRKAGSQRPNRILRFEGTKIANATHTAQDFYAPEFHYTDEIFDGSLLVHLGNNGVLSLIGGGNLSITKEVLAASGLTAPDTTFEFTVNLDGSSVDSTEHIYNITDQNGNLVSTGTLLDEVTKIYLKDGQTATILGLSPDTTYSVTETQAAGFTTTAENETGVILANETSAAKFTNTYSVSTVTLPDTLLKGEKQLAGRPWQDGDSFTFFLSPYGNAPLPEGYDAVNGISVTKPDTAGGDTATFEFGSIEFYAPGTYRYTIYEKEPENDAYLPGMSYSRALYRMVVVVVDNGNGTLSIDENESEIQKLYEDDSTPLFSYQNNTIVMNEGYEAEDEIKFINTYSVDDVIRVPVALKDYTDNSGENPLVSGMFDFELEAIGVVENGEVVENSRDAVPMPQGSTDGVITATNEGHNITFPGVTFSQSLIPAGKTSVTFRYKMSEVIPATKVAGMVYDETSYEIDVVVSVDGSHTLNVAAIYPNDEYIITFKNTYSKAPAYADINGIKVLNGRDMKQGEEFNFVLGAAPSTALAIRDGIVVVPGSSTATVTNAKNGVETGFSFSNIKFTKSGRYVFTVSETAGDDTSLVYDNNTVYVTVVVEDTANDGTLDIVSVTYGGDSDATAAKFVNTYTSTFNDTPVSLSGTKTLTGKSLLAGEFYFMVEEFVNGTKANTRFVTHTAAANGTNSGTITILEKVTYNSAGTYEYYISEQIPEQTVHGTVYSDAKYRYTVVVKDNLEGALVVDSTKLEVLADTGYQSADSIVFNNTYTPDPTTATLPLIKKVVSGDRNQALKQDEFKFELTLVSADPADAIVLPSTTVVGNLENGDIVFDAITFTKAGRFTVAVKEIVPDDASKVPGITYSTQNLIAVFEVVDDRNGKLTATIVNFTGGDEIINNYAAAAGQATINISKQFTGRENNEWLTTDSFAFKITADENTAQAIKDGKIVIALDQDSEDTATVEINEKGEVVTKNIEILKTGVYKFTVSEINKGIAGVTYDTSVKEIVIAAYDDSENAQIKVDINETDSNTVSVVFNNIYETESANFTLNAVKKLIGRALNDKEFNFVIADQDGNIVSKGTNTPDGNIVFNKIVIDQAGTYTYIVYEETGTLENVTYDKTQYIVEITVTDNEEGKLVVSTPVIKNKNTGETVANIEFENVYTEPPKESPETGDNFNIKLWAALILISGLGFVSTLVFKKVKKVK